MGGGDPVSWPDMLTADGEPELPLRAIASALAAGGFCADCLKHGKPCQDHRGVTP
jgi:hypothetical protein